MQKYYRAVERKPTSAKRPKERRYLLHVIQGLRYLGRQGIALQGLKKGDNFTQLTVLFGAMDVNMRDHFIKSSEIKILVLIFKMNF